MKNFIHTLIKVFQVLITYKRNTLECERFLLEIHSLHHPKCEFSGRLLLVTVIVLLLIVKSETIFKTRG
jgi:hypothetical protein